MVPNFDLNPALAIRLQEWSRSFCLSLLSAVYNKIPFSLKKESNLIICDNLEKSGGHELSEIIQACKDKLHMISVLYGIQSSFTHRNTA